MRLYVDDFREKFLRTNRFNVIYLTYWTVCGQERLHQEYALDNSFCDLNDTTLSYRERAKRTFDFEAQPTN